MQRPILVLAIVVAAIGALLFGVFALLKDPGKPDNAGPAPVVKSDTQPTKPNEPAKLSGDTTKASTKVQASTEDLRESDPAANFKYDNEYMGRVVNKEGAGVADAKITMTQVGTATLFFVNDPVDHSRDLYCRTDKDGKFSLASMEPKQRYKLIVQHPEYTRKEIDTVAIGPSGKFEETEIVLSQGPQLSGHIKDEGGNVVPNATLYLDGLQYQTSPYEPPDRMTASSGSDGVYQFKNIPAGQRVLTVIAKGYGNVTVPGLIFQDNADVIPRDITLKVAEMIAGTVVGPGNVGIPNAKVMAIGFSSTHQSARAEVLSNANGEFTFENLMPGPYNVLANCRGWRFEKAMRVNSNTQHIVIEGFKEADACGTVVDAESGKPIPSFKVRLRLAYPGNSATQPIPESETVVTGAANGEFCIPGVQASGDGGYIVEAQSADYAPGFSTTFNVTGGKSVSGITVRLGHGGGMTGRIVDPEGKPVAHALIATHPNDWTEDAFTEALGAEYPTQATSASARSNAQGYFTIKNLTPDLYQITVDASGFTQKIQMDINVPAGEIGAVGDVRMIRGGTVRGHLFDPSGKPVPGGKVELSITEGDRPIIYRTKTALDGAYVIPNITPGRYKLTGAASGDGSGNPFEELMQQKSSERQITVSDGETQNGVDVNLTQ